MRISDGSSDVCSSDLVWPQGLTAHGRFDFTVTTDILDEAGEANDAGNGESNNIGTATVVSAPDLTIANLAIAEAEPKSGDTITLNWAEANIGNAATLARWSNRILVVNTATGQTLVDTSIASDTQLAGGAARTRNISFRLPDGPASERKSVVEGQRVSVRVDR